MWLWCFLLHIMIITSWNVNSVRARIDNIKEYLKKFSPDVVMMQEIKTQDETFPYDDFSSLDYESHVFGQKSYNGVAIISKHKLENIRLDLIKDKLKQSRIISAEVKYKKKNIQIINIYTPNGNPVDTDKYNYKKNWLDSLIKQLKNLSKKNEMSIDELKQNIENGGIRFSKFIDNIRYELILKQIKSKEISSKINISEFEIESQLRKNAVLNPDVYNISHILIKNSNDASPEEIENNYLKSKKVYDLLSKKSFEEVAKEYSEDGAAQNGGNLGWKKEQELPTLFNEQILKINVGEITQPFKSPNGFHILKINEKKGIKKNKVLIKQTKMRHIIIKQNEITPEEEILKRLNRFRNLIIDGSETFENLAKEYSEDGSAASGGDLGWVSPGTTLPIFESTYEDLDINQISKPINSPLGWHIVQVTDRRENDLTDESIKYSARMQLVKQKTELIFKDWIKQLRDQSFVDIRMIQD